MCYVKAYHHIWQVEEVVHYCPVFLCDVHFLPFVYLNFERTGDIVKEKINPGICTGFEGSQGLMLILGTSHSSSGGLGHSCRDFLYTLKLNLECIRSIS